MFKPTTASRVVAPLRSSTRQYTQASVRPVRRQAAAPRFKTFATETTPPPPPPPPASGGSGHSNSSQTAIILGALAVIGAGGYYLLKPVADVAKTANTVVKSAQEGTGALTEQASSIAKAMLPPGAFSIYSTLASQPGGINGFFSSIKDKDLQGVLDEVKKVGGEDVKRITEKVEKRVKESKGRPQDIDWKSLAQELKEELPKNQQHYVDLLIGKLPDKEDLNKFIEKAKKEGAEQFKQAEKAASKVMEQVEKAKKDGKGQANAFLNGLKQAAPGDVDDLVKQLKEAAKKAGLPADQIESWLASKADDKKVDVEALAQQVQDKLQTAAKFLPNDPQDVVKQVSEFSPSLAKLLQQALEQAEVIKNKK